MYLFIMCASQRGSGAPDETLDPALVYRISVVLFKSVFFSC